MMTPSSFTYQQLQSQLINPYSTSPERQQAVRELARSYPAQAVPLLITALADSHTPVRKVAAEKLGALRDRRAVVPLIQTLRDNNGSVRVTAARSLYQLGEPRSKIYALQ